MIEARGASRPNKAGGTRRRWSKQPPGTRDGLALVAASKGYQLILVIPDKMSQEKLLHLRALGAKIVMTRSDVGQGHPQYYQDMAARIARETPGAFYVNQFNTQPIRMRTEQTTGRKYGSRPIIKLDAVVCGVELAAGRSRV